MHIKKSLILLSTSLISASFLVGCDKEPPKININLTPHIYNVDSKTDEVLSDELECFEFYCGNKYKLNFTLDFPKSVKRKTFVKLFIDFGYSNKAFSSMINVYNSNLGSIKFLKDKEFEGAYTTEFYLSEEISKSFEYSYFIIDVQSLTSKHDDIYFKRGELTVSGTSNNYNLNINNESVYSKPINYNKGNYDFDEKNIKLKFDTQNPSKNLQIYNPKGCKEILVEVLLDDENYDFCLIYDEYYLTKDLSSEYYLISIESLITSIASYRYYSDLYNSLEDKIVKVRITAIGNKSYYFKTITIDYKLIEG